VSVEASIHSWDSLCGINGSQRHIAVRFSLDYFGFLLTVNDSTVLFSYLVDVPNLSLCMIAINFFIVRVTSHVYEWHLPTRVVSTFYTPR
jgi:hypothetical protein